MQFGPVAPKDGVGAILAHSISLSNGRLRKGRILTTDDCAALLREGHSEVWIARTGEGDVHEDAAASRLASALLSDPESAGVTVGQAATGRVNLHSSRAGVLTFDTPSVHSLNKADPGITLAVLPPFARVAAGQMIGTVKIIPYAVEEDALVVAEAAAARASLTVRPASVVRVELIETMIDRIEFGAKGVRAVKARVEALGSTLAPVRRVPHDVERLAEAIGDTDAGAILILTASATSDVHDVAPEALRRAGGHVVRFGMPVDPGNLLFLGEHRGRPVIGLPGCARSPALNGADWVLDRVLTGLPCGDDEIAAMGVGGLLKETRARGRPREA